MVRRCIGRSASTIGISIPQGLAPPGRSQGWRSGLPGSGGVSDPILCDVRRGILGGTFDPPHFAHLIAGEAAYRQLRLDVVSFIPAGSPWQKANDGVSPAQQRWDMTSLATAGVDYFEADDREVGRDGWTYTVETLSGFPADEELVLILGADAAARLPTWHRSDEVIERARVAVMPRPGTSRAAVVAAGVDAAWLEVPEIAISGTMLRERRRAGRSIRFFVREPVYHYIEERRLYAP